MQTSAVIDEVEVGYWHERAGGVDFVFVDHPSFLRPGGLYGDQNGVYGDNQWRFKLLCQAGLEAALQVPLGERGVYGQDIVFVANGTPARDRADCMLGCALSGMALVCFTASCLLLRVKATSRATRMRKHPKLIPCSWKDHQTPRMRCHKHVSAYAARSMFHMPF